MKTALIAGATGLIGRQLLEYLLRDPYYARVKAITRKPLELKHEKLQNLVIHFDDMRRDEPFFHCTHVFCCLGTTIKQARTKDAFRKVDFEYPLELARLAQSNGASQYLLVSALGANESSSIYYNQVKGAAEEAIREVGFDGVHIFRPSLLLGSRTEERAGEDAAKLFYKIVGVLIPKKYKAIDAAKVSRAMLAIAKENKKGVYIYESGSLQDF